MIEVILAVMILVVTLITFKVPPDTIRPARKTWFSVIVLLGLLACLAFTNNDSWGSGDPTRINRPEPTGDKVFAYLFFVLLVFLVPVIWRQGFKAEYIPRVRISLPIALAATVLSFANHLIAKINPCCGTSSALYFGYPYGWLRYSFGVDPVRVAQYSHLSIKPLVELARGSPGWHFAPSKFLFDGIYWLAVVMVMLTLVSYFAHEWRPILTGLWSVRKAFLRWRILLTSTILVVILVVLTWWQPVGIPLSPNDQDALDIAAALQNQYVVFNAATCKLDGSHLAEIYANDPRGGLLLPEDLLLVQAQNPGKSYNLANAGLLDAQQAYLTWYASARPQYEAFLKADLEKGQLIQKDEYALIESFGSRYHLSVQQERGCGLGYALPFSQVTIQKGFDIAHVHAVVYRNGSGSMSFTLVKRHGKWYTIGINVTVPKSHGLG